MYVGRVQPDVTWSAVPSPGHFTAAMAFRKEQAEASWKDLPLPDRFPEPHAERSDVADQGDLGGTLTAKNTEERTEDHPQHCGPNLLLMLKAAESWRMPHGRDRERQETAGPMGEAQKTDMVSETGTF